ncbi:MAG: hypothetical protein PHH08_03410, partial [Candidatus ainarchaeum sp.]|nr:hypothetical protein [Candidatus ainarchaeum sp.]
FAEVIEPAYAISVTGTNFLPANINAGDFASLAVTVKNNAINYVIPDLNGSIDLGSQFEPIQNKDFLSGIKPGSVQTLIFKFRVKENTTPGYYPVSLTTSYTREDSTVSRQTQAVSIPVSNAGKNLDVTISPKVINPGNQTNVVFKLKNPNGNAVSNIAFSWAEATNLLLPVGSDNKGYVPVIQAGGEEAVSYVIAADPNITPGIYPITVTMTFNDVNGARTQASQVGLIIGGSTDFEVNAEISTSSQLSISIANIGSNNAGAVVVKILPQGGIRVSGSSTSIIGNLNKGDYTIANFSLLSSSMGQAQAAGAQQPGQGNFPADTNRLASQRQDSLSSVAIEIDYTDTTGERHAVQKAISLSRESPTGMASGTGFSGRQSQGNLIMQDIALVLLAVFIAVPIAVNHKLKRKNWKILGIILVIEAGLFLASIFLFSSNIIGITISAAVSLVLAAWFFYKRAGKQEKKEK